MEAIQFNQIEIVSASICGKYLIVSASICNNVNLTIVFIFEGKSGVMRNNFRMFKENGEEIYSQNHDCESKYPKWVTDLLKSVNKYISNNPL